MKKKKIIIKSDNTNIIIPENNISVNGLEEKFSIPFKAKLYKLNILYFDIPTFLSILSYSIPICLKPIHDLNPRNKYFFLLNLIIV